MKLVRDYFYPFCGYQEGWCNKRSKCEIKVNLLKISEKIRSKIKFCEHFIEDHPRTGENYKEFIRNRGK